MLPRRNRIVEPGDFRRIVRRGDKSVTKHLVGYRIDAPETRVGIIVTTQCGNAVTRNVIRRRTRAITRSLIETGQLTGDVIFRFTCQGSLPDFDKLTSEITECVTRWENP